VASVFTGQMPFPPPNQQHQSTEDICQSAEEMKNNYFLKYHLAKTCFKFAMDKIQKNTNKQITLNTNNGLQNL